MKKILIVTEAFSKTINGVWTTLKNTGYELEKGGYDVRFVTPEQFKSIDCPTYKEIQLVINPWKFNKIFDREKPDFIHIATEGPLALYAIKYCVKHGLSFTTSFHTKIPEYVNKRFPIIPVSWGYKYLRYLHKHSKAVLVTTASMKQELAERGFNNLVVWGRGVNIKVFNSSQRIPVELYDGIYWSAGTRKHLFSDQVGRHPVLLYVGRVSIEKNLEAFLNLDMVAEKVVVGDGPMLEYYKKRYPAIRFKGVKRGKALAYEYANADVSVFPSVTDTFGITMIESSACGTPVAAFPVTGPKDYIYQGATGFMHENLARAVSECFYINRAQCEHVAKQYTWARATEVFERSLLPVRS